MKAVFTLLVLMVFLSSTPVLAQKTRMPDSIDVVIRLHKRLSNARVDSVLVFFDKYDHSGAGVIKQVCYPANNQVVIHQVPEGRYFIGVFCLGAHMQYMTNITFINKKRSNNLKFNLDRSEEYTPGSYSPSFLIDFSNLAITNFRSFK
jgi:hypothetical protein